jgi:hypothetical protein
VRTSSASPPSTIAFWRNSMRRTSACSDDRHRRRGGILGAERPALAGARARRPTASWYATDAVATPFMPTMMRASFIIWNM